MKKVLFVMDAIENISYEKDTSLQLMRGAFANSYQVFYCLIEDLDLVNHQCFAKTRKLELRKSPQEKLEVLSTQYEDLSGYDSIWIRKDPPFDRSYFYATLFLDYLPASCKVINKPQSLRDWNEKLAAHFYPEYQPESLASSNQERILEFISKHPRTTLKPIDGFAGRGIVFTDAQDLQRESKIQNLTHSYSQKIICQRYLPEAAQGDKRVLLWNGEILGSILRLHPEGKEINNLDAGGTAHPSTLTPKQNLISQKIAKDMKEKGIFFSGIDFLGDYLIEINITSPTGLVQLCKFEDKDFHIKIFQELERL